MQGDGDVVEVQVDSTVDGIAVKVRDGHLDGLYDGEKLGVEVRDDGAAVKEHDG